MFIKTITAAAVAAVIATGAYAQDKTGWPSELTIGTASQGGTYFVYGNGFGGYISEALGVNATGEVTGGPVQNVTLVQTGDHLMGLVTMGPAYDAWNGKSELAPGLEHKDIRALFPMYQTPFQVVALKSSGITSVSDLAGKRVSVGPAGGTPGTYWPQFITALGIEANVSNAGAADAAGQLSDGLIDAFAFAAGVPIAAFSELAAQQDVVMFGLTPEEQAKVLEAYPAMAPFVIPSGTYAGHDYDQNTVALWNFAIAHKDMPDSLAYEITKLALDNNERMLQIHATASETIPENWDKNTFMPFHPGAVKYFEEKGITIPDTLK
ncbi:MAG: TAXI family TRAP transporter solute-binding subunit [Hoeflea sp.]|uniref:TAXI family TRAP transporter solute-binding subunit n=1 Tax=Hoeflea sp. TaxID=1940281 RepID=UPI001E074DA1|nr:TAXI family TRAP transporter solute-binding subunit [Hoeflea sp.]MBU4528168.1 TAXI family TRAP transporter solute-binding subunit [Alphaproteobacteria bacterium]MBU4543764.1 TAXI family TRAP transporter solute-binding subunit [Alphaproteobacteria bacterium]MBU4548631.1 TAXI family TRAP transporter solute-binding subunit [Alphaproteobacteria bacterium]MBV1725797.1 TAXI family TRAP transporter solute-binding subunit [Hoeflea sp.]MBV1762153.1 TAXI family TRAP transporter solute-binding subunit